jgi:uncharacterized protein YaiE (UPF0345 family)
MFQRMSRNHITGMTEINGILRKGISSQPEKNRPTNSSEIKKINLQHRHNQPKEGPAVCFSLLKIILNLWNYRPGNVYLPKFKESAMFKTNEYFEGKVVSVSHNGTEGKATVGVMAPGEYEFGTSTIEIMTVISGSMDIKMPGEQQWKTYKKFESFEVPAGVKFGVKVSSDTPYLCIYK